MLSPQELALRGTERKDRARTSVIVGEPLGSIQKVIRSRYYKNLNEGAQDIARDLAQRFMVLGTVQTVDIEGICRIARLTNLEIELSSRIEEEGMYVEGENGPKINPALKEYRSVAKLNASLSSAFFMDPHSRLQIKREHSEEKKLSVVELIRSAAFEFEEG